MKSHAHRLVVIGVDGGMLSLAERFMRVGRMPHLARLAARGVLTESLPSIPVDTPTNWTTIMTGAEPANHGVYSFTTHIAGEPMELGQRAGRNLESTFGKAEFLWTALEREGRRCVVVNYPTGWPSALRHGAVIGGMTPGGELWRIAKPVVFATSYPGHVAAGLPALKITWKPLTITPAPGAARSPRSASPVREARVKLGDDDRVCSLVLSFQDTSGVGYDRVVVTASDGGAPLTVLKPGEWSQWVQTRFGDVPAVFKMKLVHLDPEARGVELYVTDVFRTEGWTRPAGLEAGIISSAGPYVEGLDCPYVPVDMQTRPYGPVNISTSLMLEHADMQADWMIALASHLRTSVDWDALVLHFHYLDALNHTYLGYLYDRFPMATPAMTAQTWDLYGESYGIVDRLIGGIVEGCADGNTLVVITSDHAALPCWRHVSIAQALARAGLLTYKWDAEGRRYLVDIARSAAIPYLDPQHVWVNLAGREPEGVVPPGAYEHIREEILRALWAIRDPEDGTPPVRLAARSEDLGGVGRARERIGDVVFFLRPGYTTWDGTLQSLRFDVALPERMTAPVVTASEEVVGHHTPYLPTATLGEFTNSAMTLFAGPGVRRGVRRMTPMRLVDLAPTVAHLVGLPPLPDANGGVVADVMDRR